MMEILGLIPGAVTPLGILNDEQRKVAFYVDEVFAQGQGLIGVHPNDNTATVWMKLDDLIQMIQHHGNEVHIAAL